MSSPPGRCSRRLELDAGPGRSRARGRVVLLGGVARPRPTRGADEAHPAGRSGSARRRPRRRRAAAGAPWADSILPLLGPRTAGRKGLPPRSRRRSRRAAPRRPRRSKPSSQRTGLTPVAVEDPELARFLEGQGRLIRVGDGLAIGSDAYEQAKRVLLDECRQTGSITLARFRDLLGISRKPAQLLLERFDADGLTRRIGDARVLRRGATIDG